MHKHPLSPTQLRRVPSQFSWVDQRLVREHWIDHLSHEACALYLFLVTVADAQGLSYYAESSLCQRLSMTGPELHQARQALITQDLVAYQRPLSQVLALDAAPSEATPRASTLSSVGFSLMPLWAAVNRHGAGRQPSRDCSATVLEVGTPPAGTDRDREWPG